MIFETMKYFGYSEQESKVYLTLLKNDKLTGYEISKQSGIARSKIYNILEGLVQKGILLVTKTEPQLYSALPAKELVAHLKTSTNEKLDHLDDYLDGIKPQSGNDLLWSLENEAAIFDKVDYLLSQAQKSVYLQLWEEDLSDSLLELLQVIEARTERFLLIIFTSQKDLKLPLNQYYCHGFVRDKLADMGSRWVNLVCDDESVLFGSVGDHYDVIWTQNKAMLTLAKEYVKHDAYSLKIIKDFGDVLQSHYGEDFETIRDIY